VIVYPAVDVLGGKVVQLVGGVEGTEQVSLPDPLSVALRWRAEGARYLHLIDLDAAFGREPNAAVEKVVRGCGMDVQVGGGVRSEEFADRLLHMGAKRVIAGTRAIKEPEWLGKLAVDRPGKVVLAMDTKGGKIQVKGWQESAQISLDKMFQLIEDLPLAAVLHTDVGVEGRGGGIDAKVAEDFITRCPHDVIASGGITTMSDIDALKKMGAAGAVVGLALYKGTLPPRKIWG
jgi:phosphoribosylformimino-5-aminoimidazole carboxamide ribotide isomerase